MSSRHAARVNAAVFLPVAVALAVLLVSRAGGAYGLSTRTALGTIVWAALALAAAVGLVPVVRLPATTRWLVSLLLALAAWTALSAIWDASAENAVDEALRVLLFAGVLAGSAALIARGRRDRWSDGLGWGIAAVAALSLASRLFPGAFPSAHALTFLSGVQSRLSYPVGYWTGLGVLMALGFPLLLRTAIEGDDGVTKGVAAAAAALLIPVLYLTSARLGVLALAAGLLVHFAGSARRFALVGAAAAAAAGGSLATVAVTHYPELVNGPFRGSRASSEGRIAAVEVLACLGATGFAYAWASAHAGAPPRVSQRGARTAVAVTVALAAVAAALAHPIRRFDQLRANPADTTSLPVQQHLLSGSSNGRWQLWHSALDEFAAHPWLGHGAGSFQAWWAQHGTIAFFTRNAHSLFLEELAELGPVGAILVTLVFAIAIGAGIRRVRLARGSNREVSAALLGTVVAYTLSAAMDWMWQVTVVTLIAFVATAILFAEVPADGRRSIPYRWARPTLAVVGVAVALCQGVVYLAERSLDVSRSSAAADRLQAAATDASAARTLEPWAASPYTQLALVAETAGRYVRAQQLIDQAIARDTNDADLFLVKARIAGEQGDVNAALRAQAVARRLSPHSVLLNGS